MKFTCKKSLLLSAILNVSRAVPAHSSISALEGILIEAGSELKLTGFNLEIGICETVEADVTAPGGVIVMARLLTDIIRRLPDEDASFFLNDKMILHIESGKSVFDISSCLSNSLFPQMSPVEEENIAVFSKKMLCDMIRGTLFAVSENDAKKVHMGSKFIWEEERLTIVSIDGFRMAIRTEKNKGKKPEKDFVVPGMALRELERLMSGEEEEDVRIIQGGSQILFEIGSVTLTSRLLEGEFLNYQTLIPQNLHISVSLDIKEFIACLGRVSLLINEKIKNPVRLILDRDKLRLSCTTALGAAQDVCPAQVEGIKDGESLEIGVNHKYFLDALHALPNNDCDIRLSGPLSPLLIVPKEGDSFLYMILPVRLRTD